MASTRKRSARSRRQDESSSASASAAVAVGEEDGAAVAGMEASRFGFPGFSEFPAFKFDPTDADIVASYLFPRALYGRGHIPSPYPAAAVIEDDAARCEPWTLMREHGHDGSAHALFVHDHPDRATTKEGGRRPRAVRVVKNGAGVWQMQKTEQVTLTILRDGGGGELDVVYKRRNLSFHRAGESTSTGWVMHEYEITSPPFPTTVLSRIRATSRAKDKKLAIKDEPAAAGDDKCNHYPSGGYNAGGHSWPSLKHQTRRPQSTNVPTMTSTAINTATTAATTMGTVLSPLSRIIQISRVPATNIVTVAGRSPAMASWPATAVTAVTFTATVETSSLSHM